MREQSILRIINTDIVLTNENPVLQNEDLASDAYMTSIKKVDFNHPELCVGCVPIDYTVEDVGFLSYIWRDLWVTIIEVFLRTRPQANNLYYRSRAKHYIKYICFLFLDLICILQQAFKICNCQSLVIFENLYHTFC